MKHFLFRLLPPRPTFITDMTTAEAALMQAHSQYWRELMAKDVSIVFGPVLDPKGPYGICVFRAPNEAEARILTLGDPTLKAEAGFRYELLPMAGAVCRE